MPLEPLPPWLQVSPHDFVVAAAQGAQLGHAIADSTLRAWEEQARMRMASQEAAARREQAAYQHETQLAMERLANDRLEQYRQQEAANAKAGLGLRERELGSTEERNKTLQQRADDADRHNQAMEKIREEAMVAQAKARPTAGIVSLPDAPGFKFLQNPSGALTPLERPVRPGSELERARLRLSALNAMAPKGGEDQLSADYNARTNAIGGILRALDPTNSAPKRLRYNPSTGKVEEVAPLPQVIPTIPTGGSGTIPQDDEE